MDEGEEIRSHAPVSLLDEGSVHSDSASYDNYGGVFPDELLVSLFPWWVPTLSLDSIYTVISL